MNRKLGWSTIFLWLVLSASLTAGERYEPRLGFRLGFQGGVTLPHFGGAANAGWNSTAGPVFGAYATYSFNSIVAMQGGVLYTTKGAEKSSAIDKITLRYVQFVGMIRINPPLSKWDRKRDFLPKILFGLSEGVKASDNFYYVDASDNYTVHKTDPSILLGGGFDVPVDARWRVTFDVLFDISFDSFTDYRDLKNNAVLFMMGLAF